MKIKTIVCLCLSAVLLFYLILAQTNESKIQTNSNSSTPAVGTNIDKSSPNTNKMTDKNIETLPTDLSKVPTVTYCELIKNSADFDHKIVRLRAIYFNEFERSYIYDSRCEKDTPPEIPEKIPAETWAEWDNSSASSIDSDEAKLSSKAKTFGQKDLTVIGKFFATYEKGDANAPNLFGHLNCCRYQFSIMRVESINSSKEKYENPVNKFGNRVKYKVNQKLEFEGFTLECIEQSKSAKSESTFNIKKGDKEITVSANGYEFGTEFTFNGINYLLAIGFEESQRMPKDELIVSKRSK